MDPKNSGSDLSRLTLQQARAIIAVYGRYINLANNYIGSCHEAFNSINIEMGNLQEPTAGKYKNFMVITIGDMKKKFTSNAVNIMNSTKCKDIKWQTSGSENQYLQGFNISSDEMDELSLKMEESMLITDNETTNNRSTTEGTSTQFQSDEPIIHDVSVQPQRTTVEEGPRIYKLPSSFPVFNPVKKKPVISDWLFLAENQLNLMNVPDDKRIIIVSTYLEGRAFQMAKKYLMEKKFNWTAFKKDLKDNFMPTDYEFKIRQKLMNR